MDGRDDAVDRRAELDTWEGSIRHSKLAATAGALQPAPWNSGKDDGSFMLYSPDREREQRA
jgi:hypothetical protein